MAHHLQSLFILFLLANNHLLPAQTTQFNHGFLLKLTKDLESHQYTTQLLIGTPQLPAKVVVHLSDKSTWLNCPPSSPSRTFINRNSLQRLMAKSGDQKSASAICDVYQQNPITGVGVLAEDIVTVDVVAQEVSRPRYPIASILVMPQDNTSVTLHTAAVVGDVGAETRPEMRLIVVGAVMAMPMVGVERQSDREWWNLQSLLEDPPFHMNANNLQPCYKPMQIFLRRQWGEQERTAAMVSSATELGLEFAGARRWWLGVAVGGGSVVAPPGETGEIIQAWLGYRWD
ncbi:hypothetical protein E3N88_25144 [Mikania micrantha]|uniref:Uncharacterized protein n=1 Tax=Mikania micrantha TaxID=192012 RepID=A0A5N6N5D4_9ASTR|nr:hypothetical protein E3N88_25144 [Mikania micrantha]